MVKTRLQIVKEEEEKEEEEKEEEEEEREEEEREEEETKGEEEKEEEEREEEEREEINFQTLRQKKSSNAPGQANSKISVCLCESEFYTVNSSTLLYI